MNRSVHKDTCRIWDRGVCNCGPINAAPESRDAGGAAPSADSDGGAEKMSQALEALNLAREYVDNASSCMYDGTNGHGIRKEALRRLFVIDAAIASLKSTAQTGGEAVAPEAKWPIVPPATSRVGRVYLAGPMTGYENHNFPAFNAAADCLRAEGLEVVNPADHDLIEDAQWGDYMRYDIAQLAQCESIALLPGWDKSKGATLEVHIAKALGMTVRYLEGAEATPPAPPAPLPGKPLTKDQIAALLPLIKAEVDTLSDEGRYTFAGWLPIAVRLIEKHHGIAALSAQAAPEYRTGFDEAPSTFNQEDAAPADYPPQSEIEAIAERLGATDPDDSLWRDFAHAAIDADRAQRSGVSADPLPDHRSQSEAPGIARAQQVLREMHEAQKGQPPAVDPYLFAALALDAVVPAEQAEDSAMRKDAMRWQYVKGIARHELSWRGRTWTFDLASNSANLDAATDAAIAAIGRNREAGGS